MSYHYPSYPNFMPQQPVQPPLQQPQMMQPSFSPMMIPPVMNSTMPQYVPFPVWVPQIQPQLHLVHQNQSQLASTNEKHTVKRLQRTAKSMPNQQAAPAKKRLKLNIHHRTYNSVVDTNRQMSAINVNVATFVVNNRSPVMNDIINVPITVGDRTETLPCVVASNQEEKIIVGVQFLNIFNMKVDLSPKNPIHSRLGERNIRKFRNTGGKGGRKRGRAPRIGNMEPFYPGNQVHEDNNDVLDIHVQPEDRNLMGFD